MEVSTIIRLFNQFSAGAKKFKDDLSSIGQYTKQFGKDFSAGFNETPWKKILSVKNLEKATVAAETKLLAARGRLFGILGRSFALTTPIQSAIDFDQPMKELERALGVPLERMKELRGFALKTSSELALAAKDIVELMSEASQAGIASNELEAFTKYVSNAAVAFDMAGAEIGERFAKMKNVYKLNQVGLEDLGDATSYLSNNMAAKASEVTNFTNRAAGAAAILHMSARQTAAFGTAMIAAGNMPETAARSLTSLSTRILTGGKKIDAAFELIGVSREKLKKDLEADAPTALIQFFETLKTHPAGLEALADIAGANFVEDFSRLLEKTELLTQAFNLVKDPARYAGSAVQEAAKQAEGAGKKFQLLFNRLTALSIIIGDQLLPVVIQTVDKIGAVLVGVMDWIDANPALAAGIIKTAAAIYAFNIAIRTGSFLMAGMQLSAVKFLATFLKFDQSGRNVAVGWRMIAGAGRILVISVGLLASTFGWLVATMKIGAAAIAAFVGAAFSPIGAVVAAVVAVIAAAAFALWKYWDRISSFAKGFAGPFIGLISKGASVFKNIFQGFFSAVYGLWNGFTNIISGAFDSIMRFFGIDPAIFEGIKNAFASVFDIGALWESAKTTLAGVWDWIKSFFSRENLSDEAKAGMSQAGEAWANSIIDGFSAIADWFKDLPNKIISWVKSIDLSGLIKFPSFGFFGSGNETPAMAPIGGGKTTLGEGKTTNNNSRSVAVNNVFNVTTNDPNVLAHSVAETVNRARSAAFTGVE